MFIVYITFMLDKTYSSAFWWYTLLCISNGTSFWTKNFLSKWNPILMKFYTLYVHSVNFNLCKRNYPKGQTFWTVVTWSNATIFSSNQVSGKPFRKVRLSHFLFMVSMKKCWYTTWLWFLSVLCFSVENWMTRGTITKTP